MKAIVLKDLENLNYEEIDNQSIEGFVKIELNASALNHRDVWIAKGQYAGIKFPMVLGSDGVGLDEKGKKIIINPSLNWGSNDAYQSKSYQILGLPNFGTFSDSCWVAPSQIYDFPSHLDVISAAALPLAGVTAYRSLFSRAKVKPTDKVLISGVGGGVALFAMQFAIALGCDVYVTSGHEWKIEKAISLGARGGKNYKSESYVKEFQGEVGGFDVIVDSAGGVGFSNLVKLANPGGSIVFYGGTNGNLNINPQMVFWKQLSILGSTMGSDLDFAEMLAFVNQYQIVPVVDSIFDLKDFKSAFDKMNKGEQFGKIVFRNK